MKRLMLIALLATLAIVGFCDSSFAETATQMAIMQAQVGDVFSLEFVDSNDVPGVVHTNYIPFTQINPTMSMCYSDGRHEGDGKSDNGLLCRSNLGTVWYFKMSVTATTTPAFPLANFKFYMGRPWNRTLDKPADGTLSQSAVWHPVPTGPTVLYMAGPGDLINTYGTLMTLSYSVFPQGLYSDITYGMTITYTVTTTP